MSNSRSQAMGCAILLLLFSIFISPLHAAQWTALGPDGGDVRRFAYDPHDPDRVWMGTMAGKLFFSSDAGATWSRAARLGGDDYVLDNVLIDPVNSNLIYVAAWSVETNGGDLFRSKDGGKTWQTLPGAHGKSIRALAQAASDPNILVIGAVDGVFRSADAGENWTRITPEGHSELKNFESVAIDPKDPGVIYAGTWHLPWKTSNGGASWKQIKKGMIDDSDVFSIIIDPRNPAVVYVSACSGIYKSENGAELFRKIQGMPFSARRTRVLQMDPENSSIVYAGTTEGLWRTVDAGKSFTRMTAPNIVVNDVQIDPRKAGRIMLATDRSGVLISGDNAVTFSASNRGFAHRQVAAVLLDRSDSQTLYAGVINDKEYGGVFVSHDGGRAWTQLSAGLGNRDVFTLRQTENGDLLAGTNSGVFQRKASASMWTPINTLLMEKKVPAPRASASKKRAAKPAVKIVITRSELSTRVADIAVSGAAWYAATPLGLLVSSDQGSTWKGGAIAGQTDFIAVRMRQSLIAAASRKSMVVSVDGGAHWYAANLPNFITGIRDLAVGPESTLWVASREGVFRSMDAGENWEHVLGGLPALNVNSIAYDEGGTRMLATSSVSTMVFESSDGGRRWRPAGDSGWEVRNVTSGRGQLFVTTAYDGILTQSTTQPSAMLSGGGSR